MTHTLKRIAKWIFNHVRFRTRNLNARAPHELEDSRAPVIAKEIVIKWEF